MMNHGSHVEEYRLALALEVDVEPVARVLAAPANSDHGCPPLLRHQGEDRVGAVRGLIGKIHPGIAVAQHAAREYGDQDMRRLHLSVWPRRCAGLDSLEPVGSVLVGSAAAETLES